MTNHLFVIGGIIVNAARLPHPPFESVFDSGPGRWENRPSPATLHDPFTLPAMVANTTAVNRARHHHEPGEPLWLFGYGSLIFKADFPWQDRRPASIRGWTRRFWQGSHDHRGTPSSPGRVATLIAEPASICHGVAYRVDGDVLAHLDLREKNGYLRFMTALTFPVGEPAEGLVYIATADNAAWLGPAPEAEIARHIAAAEGPSGRNSDYLLLLASALRDMSVADDHVSAIERHLMQTLSDR